MAFINDKVKEVNCKVVFFGPPLCGKSTSLRYIHDQMNRGIKDHPIALSDEDDRTLYFDFVPVDLGKIKDYNVRMHLYTVPGQDAYEQSRRLIAKGIDGLVFMADSDLPNMEKNVASLAELRKILEKQGVEWEGLPKVFQWNKRDLPMAVPAEELRRLLNRENESEFETVAITGQGILDVLAAISEKVLFSLKQD